MIKLKQRFIPEGFKEFAPELGDYPKDMFACYVNLEQPHNPKAMFFIGKQSKHAWFFRFSDIPQMKKRINQSISNLMAHEEYKAKRKEEKKIARKEMDVSVVKVGDVYHWSGGYNCTRNGYVQVLGVAGKNKFKVAKLSKTQVDGDWMNGNVAPILNTNIGELILSARVGYEKRVILRDTTSGYKDNYYAWSGRPNWENCD